MRAIVCHHYGSPDILALERVPKPVARDNEVLVKIQAASVNAFDCSFITGKPVLARLFFGLQKPRHAIPGADLAGRVEAVGRQVTQFKPGDEVFGDLFSCGLGAFAEYVAAPEDALALKPAKVTFEAAAAVPMAAVTALQGLRNTGHLQAGERVLVQGASGGVGTFAIQLAKAFGADVTAVCGTRNVDIARSIGADQVIDYTQEDFTKSARRYDLILAVNGYHPILDYRQALRPKGRYVVTGGSGAQMFQSMFLGPWISLIGNKQVRGYMTRITQEDLVLMHVLLEAGKVVPVIDRHYPLGEVAEALRYVAAGHARGKVVITMEQHGM
ncbi:MAG: NAD(P)-dependent alcohol dehydrogenase [Ktedonobacterales bacterium]